MGEVLLYLEVAISEALRVQLVTCLLHPAPGGTLIYFHVIYKLGLRFRFRASGLGIWVSGFGFRFRDSGFGLGFRVSGLGVDLADRASNAAVRLPCSRDSLLLSSARRSSSICAFFSRPSNSST